MKGRQKVEILGVIFLKFLISVWAEGMEVHMKIYFSSFVGVDVQGELTIDLVMIRGLTLVNG